MRRSAGLSHHFFLHFFLSFFRLVERTRIAFSPPPPMGPPRSGVGAQHGGEEEGEEGLLGRGGIPRPQAPPTRHGPGGSVRAGSREG